MSNFELVLPKLGESITDATIISWLKNVGDTIEEDEPICEIATDKVDSEVPSPVSGTITEILFEVDEVVEVGKVIALIKTSSSNDVNSIETVPTASPQTDNQTNIDNFKPKSSTTEEQLRPSTANRFYSPLARSIAAEENLSSQEMEKIKGTGENGRVRKSDILAYLDNRTQVQTSTTPPKKQEKPEPTKPFSNSNNVEIIQMDRMRKMIAKHMVDSKRISPHVTSFVEVDMTNVVNWRNKNKKAFLDKYGTKITFTPIFVEAVTKAIKDFPAINASVDGDNVIIKKDINIGIAAALPSGNLIVPVVKNADYLNLQGIAKQTNILVDKARKTQATYIFLKQR